MKERKEEFVTSILNTLEKSRIAKIFKKILIIGSIVIAILSVVSAVVLYKTDFIKKLKNRNKKILLER